ncbi:putative disease resistance RPP13-like protein 1 [Ziziphus jujuba]|uniref:Disease resistance RPP13-like protein 1 n=1 Tax=Ziziphus jujuba TaxID=326968 RepID=A0A6P4AFD3_ZIZJJ|nr:putative disease resistance RPP13-like protein 1 [Ziziphus jujuba]XP_060671731.1 putative disease resistance RPP13-like protein 1 [Ziziphus jujuba]
MAVERVIGGAFLSASVEQLFETMASQDFNDFVREKKLKTAFDKLQFMLSSVGGVLNDAETKQLTDPSVRRWLDDLKDAIYHVEDLVCLIKTEAELEGTEFARRRRRSSRVRKFISCAANQEENEEDVSKSEMYYSAVEGLQSESGIRSSESNKVRNLFQSYRLAAAKKEYERIKGIKEIFVMLSLIMGKIDHLDLRKGVETKPLQRSYETSLLEEVNIYGRDHDKDALLKLLISHEGDGSRVDVIPIIGMGGVGKTALAQLVYMDRAVDQHFDFKAWITVSHDYDVFTITKRIYQKVAGLKRILTEETFELQQELQLFLGYKRCLLVFDDVWNLNFNRWCAISCPLKSIAYGSKIIVTTRDGNFASMIGSVPNYSLQYMSEEACWQLFSNHALNKVDDPSVYEELAEIGRKIVRKYQGFPLVIKSFAGLLRAEQNPRKWENILKKDISELPQGCDVLSTLWSSYNYLPPHLKRCFAYCSIFPKNYVFTKKKLILLWMAEDLLIPEKNKMLEEVGEEYFDDLTARSFFHKNEMYGFTMHDLVNDLAQFVAGEYCLRSDDNYSDILPRKTRYLSWMEYLPRMENKTDDIKKVEDVSKKRVLRTILRLDGSLQMIHDYFIHPKGLQNFRCLRVLSLYRVGVVSKLLGSIGKLKLLRYLDLSWTEVEKIPDTICGLYNLQTLLLHCCRYLCQLPDSIGNLKHLRYLDLSNTEVTQIPDGVCNLHNLHTLLLRSCRNITHLPTNMARLINLRHLDISATSLRQTPPQLSNLRYLEILGDLVAGTSSGSSLKVLNEVQDVRGTLCIRNLEEVKNVDDVSKANLKDEKCITDLRLEWQGDTYNSQKARKVLNRLQPHTDLERLSIINYGGLSFSDWIGDHIFSSVVYMWLSKCKRCHSLPPIGQLPSLKSLSIDGFDMVERVGNEFYFSGLFAVNKPFKSLEKLSFKFMPRWEEWSVVEDGVFSQLKELHLMDCPSLALNRNCFPDSLPSLTHLYISKCQQQVVALLLSCQLPLLGSLYIGYCPELKSFPQRSLPTNIHAIEICGCENLNSFSDEG